MRSDAFLVAGCVAGLTLTLLAALAPMGDGAGQPEPGAAASVNAVSIPMESLQSAIDAVNSERRSALTPADKRRVLERLIDEELLFQHGLSSGIARRDPSVRNAIVQGVMAAVRDMPDAQAPTLDELRAHYQSNDAYFRSSPMLRAAYVFVMAQPLRSRDAAQQRATEALALMKTSPAAAVDAFHDGGSRLPDTLLPGDKLRDYVGGPLSQQLLGMDANTVAGPIDGERGFYVLALIDRVDAPRRPFDEVVDAVRDHWLRGSAERRLRELLDELRDAADVRLAE